MQSRKLLSTIAILALISTSPSMAANAPAKNPSFGGGKYKTSGPIEITSDSLEVMQQEHKAIFTGHVVAVQGDVHLRSEKMTVFYKSEEEKPAAGSKAAPADKKSAMDTTSEKNSIEKIVVENNVFLSTPEETASGANGIYDVVKHKIFLNNNVVLTRDKNVLKGDRLVYDFETGKSILNAAGSTAAANSGKTKQRVKALFIPKEEGKNNDDKLPLKK